jgi:putative oxidoreductase
MRSISIDVLKPSRWQLDRWAPIPLRLIVGYGFLEHGYAKLTHGPERFAAILHALGVPAPDLMAWLTIVVELFGGLAVLLGAFVPVASVPMAIMLLTAMFTAHFQYGFSSIKIQAVTSAGAQFGPPGYEVDLLYLACLASLVLGGIGPFSLDSFLNKRSVEKHGALAPRSVAESLARGRVPRMRGGTVGEAPRRSSVSTARR